MNRSAVGRVAAGIAAAAGVTAAVTTAGPAADAAVCQSGADCTEWNANGCWDAYWAAWTNGLDSGRFSTVYVPNLGDVSGYYCYHARTIAGASVWNDPPEVLNGSTLMARTYKNGALWADTHGLGLSAKNMYKWTKQLNDADLCGRAHGWSGTSWYSTTCY